MSQSAGNSSHHLIPYALQGRIEPGLVFDRITNIDGVPDGYRAMNDREAIKVMIEFSGAQTTNRHHRARLGANRTNEQCGVRE